MTIQAVTTGENGPIPVQKHTISSIPASLKIILPITFSIIHGSYGHLLVLLRSYDHLKKKSFRQLPSSPFGVTTILVKFSKKNSK